MLRLKVASGAHTSIHFSWWLGSKPSAQLIAKQQPAYLIAKQQLTVKDLLLQQSNHMPVEAMCS
jgi:hypothetical protein